MGGNAYCARATASPVRVARARLCEQHQDDRSIVRRAASAGGRDAGPTVTRPPRETLISRGHAAGSFAKCWWSFWRLAITPTVQAESSKKCDVDAGCDDQ